MARGTWDAVHLCEAVLSSAGFLSGATPFISVKWRGGFSTGAGDPWQGVTGWGALVPRGRCPPWRPRAGGLKCLSPRGSLTSEAAGVRQGRPPPTARLPGPSPERPRPSVGLGACDSGSGPAVWQVWWPLPLALSTLPRAHAEDARCRV